MVFPVPYRQMPRYLNYFLPNKRVSIRIKGLTIYSLWCTSYSVGINPCHIHQLKITLLFHTGTYLVSRCHSIILLKMWISISSWNSSMHKTLKWRINLGVTMFPPWLITPMAHTSCTTKRALIITYEAGCNYLQVKHISKMQLMNYLYIYYKHTSS